MINVEYIRGFCYVVETDTANYVFDYVEGRLPSKYLTSQKPTYFLASSVQPEHYSDQIFAFRKPVFLPNTALLSPIHDTFLLGPNESFHLGHARISMYNACEHGLCYVIEDSGSRIVFGGPLTSIMEGSETSDHRIEVYANQFKDTVGAIGALGPIDVAMLRVENVGIDDYDAGVQYICDIWHPGHLFPMGFGQDSRDIDGFILRVKMRQDTEIHDPKYENKLFRNVGGL